MDLVVITVSYNTRNLLRDCIQSVRESLTSSELQGQIWVIDNASSDGSAEMVREHFPSVQLIAHDTNLGFAAGNNLALQHIGFPIEETTRYVLFLNPDTRVLGDALGSMVRFMDEELRAGAAGARLLHGDGRDQHSAFAFPGLAQVFFDFWPLHPRLYDSRLNGRYPTRRYEAGRPFAVDHPLGAALMVRGRVLDDIGGFDERFFMYCEEIDLCRRIRSEGWRIYCVPEARIVHWEGQSTGQFRDRMFVALWRSRFAMFEKYNSALFRWAVRRLVRMGLRSLTRRARLAHQHGMIDADDLQRRLAAYREVAAF